MLYARLPHLPIAAFMLYGLEGCCSKYTAIERILALLLMLFQPPFFPSIRIQR